MFAIRIRYVFDTKWVLEIQSNAFEYNMLSAPSVPSKTVGSDLWPWFWFIWDDVVQSIPIPNQFPSEVDFIKKGQGQNY